VKDGFLVPPKSVSVPLKFQRQGIKYDDLSDEEKAQWDAVEWSDDGSAPQQSKPRRSTNGCSTKPRWTKRWKYLMTRGRKSLAATGWVKQSSSPRITTTPNSSLNGSISIYPHYKGEFARVIDFTVEYAQSLIHSFSNLAKPPHIAISVDMLDTGIDIPEVVNLVFFKLVRSKTKFWQMLGRGTRLCPDLFAPGKHKEYFYIFDYCQNLEFFSQNRRRPRGR